MIVNVFAAPVQLPALGVTLRVAVIGVLPVFTGLKDRLPVPLALRPIAGLSFVQEYVAAGLFPLKVIWADTPLHRFWFGTSFTVPEDRVPVVVADLLRAAYANGATYVSVDVGRLDLS